MKWLAYAALFLTVTASAGQVTHGPCSPSIGSVGGNAVVNICPGEHFSSAQEAFLVAAHPTTVEIAALRFMTWFEDQGMPFFTATLSNQSDVPAIAASVDVLDLTSGASYPALSPLKVKQSGVFLRLGSKAISIGAGKSADYPLFSVQDLLNVVQPDVPRSYCPYDASISLINNLERLQAMPREKPQALVERTDDSPQADIGPIIMGRPTKEIGLLLRLQYRTIFNQQVTAYATVFVDYADTRVEGNVWYPSTKTYAALRCVTSS